MLVGRLQIPQRPRSGSAMVVVHVHLLIDRVGSGIWHHALGLRGDPGGSVGLSGGGIENIHHTHMHRA